MSAESAETSPYELLHAAEELLSSETPGTRGLWPRCVAFMIRMALEQSLDEFWARTQPSLARCGGRIQMVCLRAYVDEATAQCASAAWSGLSRACHYHAYELAPTVVELRGWHDEVSAVMRELAASAGGGATPTVHSV